MNDEYFKGIVDLGVAVNVKADDYNWLSNCTTGFNAESSVSTCGEINTIPYEYQTTAIEASPWNGTFVSDGADYRVKTWDDFYKELPTERLTKDITKQIEDEILKALSLKRYEIRHGAYYRRKYETDESDFTWELVWNDRRYEIRHGAYYRRRFTFPLVKKIYPPVWLNDTYAKDNGRYIMKHE